MSISTEGKILSFFQFETHCFVTHNLLANSTWLILKSLLKFLIFCSSLYFTAINYSFTMINAIIDIIKILNYNYNVLLIEITL